MAEPEQLGLAAEELQPARARLGHAPLDVAVLLRRHGEEHHATAERVERPRVEQSRRGAHQRGHLRIVAAGVGGAGGGIAVGMPGVDEGDELTEQRERRPVARPSRRLRAHAREREAGLRLEPDSGEGLLDQPRRLDLLEAQLRMLADPLAEPDDLLGAPVDGGVHALLQLVLRHEDSFPALFYPPWTTTTSWRWWRRRRPCTRGPGAKAAWASATRSRSPSPSSRSRGARSSSSVRAAPPSSRPYGCPSSCSTWSASGWWRGFSATSSRAAPRRPRAATPRSCAPSRCSRAPPRTRSTIPSPPCWAAWASPPAG